MVKKRFFEQYKSGKKDVELRSVKPQWKNSRIGDQAVLMCGKDILRKRIMRIHKGSLVRILKVINYKRVFPEAKTIFDARKKAREIYPDDKEFMAFELGRTLKNEEKNLLMFGVLLGVFANFIPDFFELLLIFPVPILHRFLIFIVVLGTCVVIWYLFPEIEGMSRGRKARPIFLGVSIVSAISALGSLAFYYYKSPTQIIFRWEPIADIRIDGISMNKILWSLSLAGVFNVAERVVKFLEER